MPFLSPSSNTSVVVGQMVVHQGNDQWLPFNQATNVGGTIAMSLSSAVPGNPISLVTVGDVPINVFNLGSGVTSAVTAGTIPSRGNSGTQVGWCDTSGKITLIPAQFGQNFASSSTNPPFSLALGQPGQAPVVNSTGTLYSPSGVYTVFNIKQFGAKGDGVTDDTIAVKAWIAAKEAAGGGMLYAPTGKYLCTSSVDFGATSCLVIGDAWAQNATNAIRGTYFLSSMTSGNAFTIGETGGSFVQLGIRFENIGFASSVTAYATVPGGALSTVGLQIRPTKALATVAVVLKHLIISGFAVGLDPGDCENCDFYDITLQYNNTGLRVGGQPANSQFNCQNNYWYGLKAVGNQVGIDLQVGFNLSFFGGLSEANQNCGLRIKPVNPGTQNGIVADVSFHGMWFEGNNQSSFNVTSDGVTDSGAGLSPPQVIISGSQSTAMTGGTIQVIIDSTSGGTGVGQATFKWNVNGGAFTTGVLTAASVTLSGTGCVAVFPVGTYAVNQSWTQAAVGDFVFDVSNESLTHPINIQNIQFHNCHAAGVGDFQFIRGTALNASTYAQASFYSSEMGSTNIQYPSWAHLCAIVATSMATFSDANNNPNQPNVVLATGLDTTTQIGGRLNAIPFGAQAFVLYLPSGQGLGLDSSGTKSAHLPSTGIIRLPTTSSIYERNAANSADVQLLGLDASDNMFVGDSLHPAGFFVGCKAGGAGALQIGGITVLGFGQGGLGAAWGAATVALATGSTVLTAAQATQPYIDFGTSSLAGNCTVLFPAPNGPGQMWLIDATAVVFNAHTIDLSINSNSMSTTISAAALWQVVYTHAGKFFAIPLATT